MNSEECYSNSLKWNYSFFKKIRNCFSEKEKSKNAYYCINYEKTEREIKKNNSKINIKLNNDDDDDLLDIFEIKEKKMFFEIHFIHNEQDITAFRLYLKPNMEDKPYLAITKKLLEMDKIEGENLANKQAMLNTKEKDLASMEKIIKDTEDAFTERKKQYLAKFNLLIKEKNKKIQSLKGL